MKSLKNTNFEIVDWAVAGQASPEQLVQLGIENAGEWDVLTADDGFSALIITGPMGDVEAPARALAHQVGTAFSCDFNDDAPRVIEFASDGAVRYHDQHPSRFLADHGIMVPGHGAALATPIRTVVVVENHLPEAVRRLLAEGVTISRNGIGTLIDAGASWVDETMLAEELGDLVWSVNYDAEQQSYWVFTYEAKHKTRLFRSVSMPNERLYRIEDSVRGATTIVDICRILDIRPEYLGI